MNTLRSLSHLSTQTGRPVAAEGPLGGAHRRTPRAARAWAIRGIVVLGLLAGGLGAAAAASSGHGSAHHLHAHPGAFSQPWMW